MTAASGGYTFVPYIGMDSDAGTGIVGAGLAYAIRFDRTIESETFARDVTVEGGNALSIMAFYEAFVNDVLWGGSFNYINRDEAKSKTAGITYDSKSNSSLAFAFYSRIPFESLELVPRLDYTFSNSEYSKYDMFNLSLSARFLF